MKEINFQPHGVCSRMIHVVLDDNDIVTAVTFTGGCSGNTTGISRLVEGMKAEDAISRLRGIKCGMKPTSCPDQLSFAIEKAMNQAE